MTDWERVAKLRTRGASWEEIAQDDRVNFHPPKGAEPGRALKTLYLRRGAGVQRRGSEGPVSGSGGGPGRPSGTLRGWRGIVATVVAIALLVAVAALIYVAPPLGFGTGPEIVTYCGGEGQAAHYHVLLVISDNGVQQPLPYDASQPADIGFIDQPGYTNPSYYCGGSGIYALHTHDGSGIIHAEIPSGIPLNPPPTLGNFFTIWGEPLTATQVWTFSGHVLAQMRDSDSGQTTGYSSNPASIPLYEPPGGPFSNPYAIPQNLIFNGAYGGGESGGSFDGEIIWLNITGGAGPAVVPMCLLAGSDTCGRPSPGSSGAGPTMADSHRSAHSSTFVRVGGGVTQVRAVRAIDRADVPAGSLAAGVSRTMADPRAIRRVGGSASPFHGPSGSRDLLPASIWHQHPGVKGRHRNPPREAETESGLGKVCEQPKRAQPPEPTSRGSNGRR